MEPSLRMAYLNGRRIDALQNKEFTLNGVSAYALSD